MKVLLGAISIALFVSNSTTCYLAWQVVTVSKLYLNNHAHFLYMNSPFLLTKLLSYQLKTPFVLYLKIKLMPSNSMMQDASVIEIFLNKRIQSIFQQTNNNKV